MAGVFTLSDTTVFFSEKPLISHAGLTISDGDRLGIVGRNGEGKSTLLRLLAGEIEPDGGEVIRRRNLSVTYLPQTPVFPAGASLTEAAVACMGGPEHRKEGADYEAQKLLTELGFRDLDVRADTLSGGERMKAALAGALCRPCDVLMLDEPTNHLDMETSQWLEDRLLAWRGTLLVVTHDRYLLERVFEGIIHVGAGRVTRHDCRYAGYLEQALSTSEKTVVHRKVRGALNWKRNSRLAALHALEWKQLLRTPAWSYNALAGVVMFPLMMGVGLFAGFSEHWGENTLRENEEKIRLYREHILHYRKGAQLYRNYAAVYELETGRTAEFGITDEGGTLRILAPDYMAVPCRGFIRLPFFVSLDDGLRKEKIEVTYGILNSGNELVFGWLRETLDSGTDLFELPVYGFTSRGKYFLSIGISAGGKSASLVVPMLNVLEEDAGNFNDN